MKPSLVFVLVTISASIGLIVWFFFGGTSETPHNAHREYVAPVTPTEPAELESITSLINTAGNAAVSDMLDTMHADVYAIYPCGPDTTQQALLLTAQYQQTAAGNSFDQAIAAVASWEPYALQDIGATLYPDRSVSLKISPDLQFADVPNRDYRFAEYRTGDERYAVYYGWLLNYVIFAPSLSCLDRTMSNVYEVGV